MYSRSMQYTILDDRLFMVLTSSDWDYKLPMHTTLFGEQCVPGFFFSSARIRKPGNRSWE